MSSISLLAVYPCVYREHNDSTTSISAISGLSLCIQGTLAIGRVLIMGLAVYPCVYREHRTPFGDWVEFTGLSLCIQGTLCI